MEQGVEPRGSTLPDPIGTTLGHIGKFPAILFLLLFLSSSFKKAYRKIINRYYTKLTLFLKVCGYFISKTMLQTLR